MALPTGGLSNARSPGYSLTLDDVPPGEHTIAVRVRDTYDNQSVQKTVIR